MDDSQEFRQRLFRGLRSAAEGTDQDREALLHEMAYGVEHMAEFDQQTQLLIEQVGSLLMKQVTEGVRSMPDSPEQRILRRALDLTRGEHYRPQTLLDSLESPPAQVPDFAVQGEEVCIETLQEAADLAHDANTTTTSGNDGLAFQGLVSECMQESVFGLHAARHGFHSQVYAHCRAVYEDLDLLELFRQDPAARDLWLSADSNRIRKELAPVMVRKKLGRTGTDVPYKFFSEMGTHTSIHSVIMRSRPVEGGEHERPRVFMSVGGTWERDLLLPAYVGLAMQAHHLLLETIGWSQHFKAGFDENRDRLRRTTELRAAFMNEHVIPWMRERGFPDDSIQSLSVHSDLDGP